MNTLLMIIAILFLFAGVVGGITEQDFGMMAMGIILGIALLIWRAKRIANAPQKELKKQETTRKKQEKERYEYYLTDEGKSVLMEYVTEEELEESDWDSIAHKYATELGQKVLHDIAVEKTKEEIEE